MTDTLDEAYNEYLWGEASPRAFARRTKLGGTEKISKSTRYSNGVPR
jgi:hypothetical protein